MKRILIACICIGMFAYVISCNKSNNSGTPACTGPTVAQDSSKLLQFAKDNGITAMWDSSGLYYQIISQGYGPAISSSTTISASYVGKFMDGKVFDSANSTTIVPYPLNQYIQGWQIGLPKIRKSGRILLLIPSALAFGCAGSVDGRIPPNSPLYFDITLVNTQ